MGDLIRGGVVVITFNDMINMFVNGVVVGVLLCLAAVFVYIRVKSRRKGQ